MINYTQIIHQAQHFIIFQALKFVEISGLPSPHHFYIRFSTQFPDVKISESLKKNYPVSMTIVVQHQFWDLKVEEKGFFISMSFNGMSENLYIPFHSLINFTDPAVQFSITLTPVLPKPSQISFNNPPDSNKRLHLNLQSDQKVVYLNKVRKDE